MRLLAPLLTVVCLIALAHPAHGWASGDGSDAGGHSVPGDVNCDIYVNSVDASLVLQYHAALVDSLDCLRSADPNDDGEVNSIDAGLILQFEAELICQPFADACVRD